MGGGFMEFNIKREEGWVSFWHFSIANLAFCICFLPLTNGCSVVSAFWKKNK